MSVKNRGTEKMPQTLSQAKMIAALPETTPASSGAAGTIDASAVDTTRLTGVGVAPHELRILQSLRRITRALELHSRDLVASYNITGPQLVCLLAIREKGPLTPTMIAYEVHLSSSTVVGILDRLEEKGLVHRQRDRVDRRQVNVAATEKGLALANQAPSPLQETLARALNRLPELERIAIALSLERVADLMETRDLDTAPARGASMKQRKSGGAPLALKAEAR
jgi:DNA-binding MarR family transcriptional regulator